MEKDIETVKKFLMENNINEIRNLVGGKGTNKYAVTPETILRFAKQYKTK